MVEKIASTDHIQDIDVMGQALHQRAGQTFGAEGLGPFLGTLPKGRSSVISVESRS